MLTYPESKQDRDAVPKLNADAVPHLECVWSVQVADYYSIMLCQRTKDCVLYRVPVGLGITVSVTDSIDHPLCYKVGSTFLQPDADSNTDHCLSFSIHHPKCCSHSHLHPYQILLTQHLPLRQLHGDIACHPKPD